MRKIYEDFVPKSILNLEMGSLVENEHSLSLWCFFFCHAFLLLHFHPRHGDVMFNRVFGALEKYIHGNSSSLMAEPYECIVPAMVSSFCQQAAVA